MGSTRTLDAARERFLRGGAAAVGRGEVSPAVLTSWQRSIAAGVDLVRLRASFVGHGEGSPLTSAACAVLDDLAAEATGEACALGLVDADGTVRVRRDVVASLGELLDAVCWIPGYRHAESLVGTTAAAIALRERTAVLVEGAEHLHPAWRRLRAAAAPVGGRGRRGKLPWWWS